MSRETEKATRVSFASGLASILRTTRLGFAAICKSCGALSAFLAFADCAARDRAAWTARPRVLLFGPQLAADNRHRRSWTPTRHDAGGDEGPSEYSGKVNQLAGEPRFIVG
jgi:hypothetical protein